MRESLRQREHALAPRAIEESDPGWADVNQKDNVIGIVDCLLCDDATDTALVFWKEQRGRYDDDKRIVDCIVWHRSWTLAVWAVASGHGRGDRHAENPSTKQAHAPHIFWLDAMHSHAQTVSKLK